MRKWSVGSPWRQVVVAAGPSLSSTEQDTLTAGPSCGYTRPPPHRSPASPHLQALVPPPSHQGLSLAPTTPSACQDRHYVLVLTCSSPPCRVYLSRGSGSAPGVFLGAVGYGVSSPPTETQVHSEQSSILLDNYILLNSGLKNIITYAIMCLKKLNNTYKLNTSVGKTYIRKQIM